jgi:hypothetical protein
MDPRSISGLELPVRSWGAVNDRLFFVLLYRWFPSILKTMTIIQPETLVSWHRAGFRRYWRWKSGNLGGRPPISGELRALIRRIVPAGAREAGSRRKPEQFIQDSSSSK